ncbi:MAG: response regulator [Anaerolineae bacterium]|jgi:CheY-like chemotaxis protein
MVTAQAKEPTRQILIVDDEESVAFFLRASLNELSRSYQIEIANSGEQALEILSRHAFDLVVTDLRMPGIDGLELLEKARKLYPRTRLVLMTAYGSPKVEITAYRLGACRYINKPFSIEQFATTITEALAEASSPGRDMLMLSDREFDEIARCLSDLRFEVGAQCILLADVAGQMVAHVGDTGGLDLPPLVSLIGGSFATSFAMSGYLGESQALTLNYHEGERYDVYSSNVNEDLFVVLIYDRRRQKSRVGMVWLYTRRVLARLRQLMSDARQVSGDQVLDDDFGSLLSDSLDQLMVPEGGPPAADRDISPARRSTNLPTSGDRSGLETKKQTLEEATAELQRKSRVSGPPSPPVAENDAGPNDEILSFQQALEMGLLDPSWIEADQEGDG